MIEVLSGNEAIVRGALAAKAGFFSAYPITPASEIIENIVKHKKVSFISPEDEIAAINFVIGAALAGKKAFTATSGPGFSLMQESIGFAFKVRAPIVIVDAQRVGPSTGMPTLASQGDIAQAIHGSHGDYTNIILYPNSTEECYKYTIEAFNAADESLSPVILLTDAIISHMSETVDLAKVRVKLKKRSIKALGNEKRHLTGLTSDEILTKSSSPEVYKKWYTQRKKEILRTAEKYNFYEYLENKNSDTLLIAYGIASRVILPLKEKYGIFRPIRIYPILDELKKISGKYKKIVIIEMNDGQYKKELEAFLKRNISLIRMLGGKISLEDINDELSKIR